MYLDKPDKDGIWWVQLDCSNHGTILKVVTVKTNIYNPSVIEVDSWRAMAATCCVQGEDTWLRLDIPMFENSRWIKFYGFIPDFD